MNYLYYPGCSLEKNAIAYHQSAVAVAQTLGITLAEIEDWNCCGATEYFAIDLIPAYALVGRNLALAAQQKYTSDQLVAPCSACYLNLRKTDHYMAESPELAEKVNTALEAGGLHYEPGSVQVRHLLEVLVRDIGYDVIQENVRKPLYGLRVAPYYGCLLVRPGLEEPVDDPEYPTSLDQMMRVLGAEVVDFPLKTHCCGGHMTQISEPVALEMIRRILKNAADYEADVIAVICPMCQLNLDAFQEQVNRHFDTDYQIPILYFTQLLGVAFGIAPELLGIGKEFIDARPALAKIRAEATPPPKKSRPSKNALPMPGMSD